MWGWICPSFLAVLIVIWIVWRARVHGRIFADAHFLEVAPAVARLKVAAMSITGPFIEGVSPSGVPHDDRLFISSAGLAVMYTAEPHGEQFVHHYSVSISGGYTARAVGNTFTLFVAKLLGVPFDSLALGVSPATVHHAEFVLSPEEHAKFADTAVVTVSAEDVESIRREYFDAGMRAKWDRITPQIR